MTVSRRSVARILVRGSSRWIAESTGTYWPRTSPLKNSTAAHRERLEYGDPGFLDGEDIPPDGEAAFHEAAGEQGHLRQAQTQRGEAGEVGEHRPGGAIGHQAASIEHQQALAELSDRIHAVRDQHDRQRAV